MSTERAFPQWGNAEAGRLCECGCGRSIEHKRVDALTFDASCRKRLKRRNTAEDRGSDEDRSSRIRWESTLAKANAIKTAQRMVSDGAVARGDGEWIIAVLTRERLQLLDGQPCACERPLVIADCDGDAVCAMCGHSAGPITASVNGFDAVEAALMANGRSLRSGGRQRPRLRVFA